MNYILIYAQKRLIFTDLRCERPSPKRSAAVPLDARCSPGFAPFAAHEIFLALAPPLLAPEILLLFTSIFNEYNTLGQRLVNAFGCFSSVKYIFDQFGKIELACDKCIFILVIKGTIAPVLF